MNRVSSQPRTPSSTPNVGIREDSTSNANNPTANGFDAGTIQQQITTKLQAAKDLITKYGKMCNSIGPGMTLDAFTKSLRPYVQELNQLKQQFTDTAHPDLTEQIQHLNQAFATWGGGYGTSQKLYDFAGFDPQIFNASRYRY
jgi:hypothetical protein